MRTLSDTIMRLAAFRMPQGFRMENAGPDRLSDLVDFGSNPGALRARTYLPADLPAQAPLVVVLHGCTQSAADYDRGSGWSQLADKHRFALLFPEQQRANNAHLCFNWFEPGDSVRDGGEPQSIRQMVETLVTRHGLDAQRVYVTGLSAGGAMTSTLLATHPDLFAGGAVIAGLPYGCANSAREAFERMRGHELPPARTLQALVRGASDHAGPWPTLSVWQGTGDRVVAAANAEAIIAQWRAVQGVEAAPTRTELVGGYPRRVWCDAEGRERIEEYEITGMGHGTPIDTRNVDSCGAAGSYMLDVGISSTERIARFWGLTGATAAKAETVANDLAKPRRSPRARTTAAPIQSNPASPVAAVGKIIEDALRAAGLMR